MHKPINIKIERTFGELLGDGMKMVFRHLGSMGLLLLTFAMPFIAVSLIIIILNGSASYFLESGGLDTDEGFMNLFSIYLVLGLGLGISVIMMNLIVYSTIITYYEYEGEVSADKISITVKKYLGNYALSIFSQIGVGALLVAFIGIFVMISPVLFGVVYFIMIFVGIWIFNIIQFLGIVRIEENLSIIDGIRRCFYLVQNNWWETLGLVLVTSLLGSILMYGIMILFIIVFGVFTSLYNINGMEESSILTYILYGIFFLLYLFIMSASNMYIAGVRILKYYDLVEKKEAKNIIAAIEQIGAKKNSLFENEGEY
jgi:hypothetical protein